MATTTLGDIFAEDRVAAYDVIQSYMDTDPVTTTPFFQAGILVNNELVSNAAASPTAEVVFPYFNRISPDVEPNYSNDEYEDIAIPRKVDTSYLRARAAFLNEAWSTMDLVQEITGKDPLAFVGARLNLYWQEEAELRLLATLRGLYATAAAMPENDMNVEIAGDGLVYEGILDGLATLGDNFGAIAGYVMDSRTYFRGVKEGIAEGSIERVAGLSRGVFYGLPALINDKAMRINGNSVITLLGSSAIAYGMANPKVPLEYEREAARGNGGGTEALWTRRNMIVHPLGYNFTSTSITGNGTETTARSAGWTDLANPVNWERVGQRKQVPIAFVTVGTPTPTP